MQFVAPGPSHAFPQESTRSMRFFEFFSLVFGKGNAPGVESRTKSHLTDNSDQIAAFLQWRAGAEFSPRTAP